MLQPFEVITSTPKEVVRQTSRVIKAAGGYTLGAMRESLELVIQPQSPEEFVETLMQERPISEVKVAERALQAGSKTREEAIALVTAGQILKDEETKEAGFQKLKEAKTLLNIGYSMLKLTVVKADKAFRAEEIPKEVVEEVYFSALEDGADPTINGFIPPEQATEVAEVFEKYDNRIAFPEQK